MQLLFYLNRKVLSTALQLWMMAVLLIFLLGCLGDFNNVTQDYGLVELCRYIAGTIPLHLARFYPLLISLVLALTIAKLRRTQELLALLSQGVSQGKILLYLTPSLLLMLIWMLLSNELLAPYLADRVRQMRSERLSHGQMIAEKNTVWLKTAKGFLQASITADEWMLADLNYYQHDPDGQLQWLKASNAHYLGKQQWQAEHAVQTTLNPDNKQVQLQKNNYILPIKLNPDTLSSSRQRAEYLNLIQMAKALTQGRNYGLVDKLDWHMFWLRVSQPFQVLVLATTSAWLLLGVLALRSPYYTSTWFLLIQTWLLHFVSVEILRQQNWGLGMVQGIWIAFVPILLALNMLIIQFIYKRYV